MDWGSGQQGTASANQHSMCSPSQTLSTCLSGIEGFLSLNLLLAGGLPRETALALAAQDIHTMGDWSSPMHVSDSGVPFVWNDPPRTSSEFQEHMLGEATFGSDPQRFYLGVRLIVGTYLPFFPNEQGSFKNLDTWIIDDARTRAGRELGMRTLGGYRRVAEWHRSGPSAIERERLAQCYSGNPAACDR